MLKIIQAQYYRDPTNYETYLVANKFLTDINNEIPPSRNETYARNLASLKNLVLVLFTEDKTVIPKESSWFGAEPVIEDNAHFWQIPFGIFRRAHSSGEAIPMRLQPIYLEDWIGLKELDERNGIIFETCKGEHMQLGDCWEDLVIRFTGENV